MAGVFGGRLGCRILLCLGGCLSCGAAAGVVGDCRGACLPLVSAQRALSHPSCALSSPLAPSLTLLRPLLCPACLCPQRLEYLAEEEPEAAGTRPLLDVVMASKAAFERHHPAFPAWLEARWRREEEERALRAAERAERLAQAAADAAAGPAGLEAPPPAAAAAAAREQIAGPQA